MACFYLIPVFSSTAYYLNNNIAVLKSYLESQTTATTATAPKQQHRQLILLHVSGLPSIRQRRQRICVQLRVKIRHVKVTSKSFNQFEM